MTPKEGENPDLVNINRGRKEQLGRLENLGLWIPDCDGENKRGSKKTVFKKRRRGKIWEKRALLEDKGVLNTDMQREVIWRHNR